ncbi:MAG: hypothetical protein QW220_05140 [Candidatus Bathyarchaeia archaeon]
MEKIMDEDLPTQVLGLARSHLSPHNNPQKGFIEEKGVRTYALEFIGILKEFFFTSRRSDKKRSGIDIYSYFYGIRLSEHLDVSGRERGLSSQNLHNLHHLHFLK